ncbi:MAG: tryptophan-rich sensory protein [Crocinitomicaceae bacterium]|nr:tryptophan-rich sensory protein [Crocinitomicaceae bacterium]MBK8925196.1 tryptophan-rich sensory protein [Crocinitomicaceae bacterium]
MIIQLIIFLLLNFGALALGGLFTGSGVSSDWYNGLNKAPWTPPGWMFGLAWTTIMICFSVYMAKVWNTGENKNFLIILFVIQWILNVSWNPVFFYFNFSGLALVLIVLLAILVGLILYLNASQAKWFSLLILPYFVWLLIATSLNAYIVFKN